jgi:hypothetical protein
MAPGSAFDASQFVAAQAHRERHAKIAVAELSD